MSLRNPEQFPVKFYSWQDNDAPQLANADGCIKTILKACLVTGYGGKDGAGWEMLFDEAYRMVLRRPLRTGNPPDIKIENGVINGVASHRIVAQDNPSSLDDSNELSAVNLLSKDSTHGKEWYLFVTDFAFMLCYQMAEHGQNLQKTNNYVLFVGSMKRLAEQDEDYFFVSNYNTIQKNGMAYPWLGGFFYHLYELFDMRKKIGYQAKKFINIDVTEAFTGDYFAQKVLIDKVVELPFFTSVSSRYDDMVNKPITLNNRAIFRFVNRPYMQNYGSRALYIPLDYWEL